MLEFKSVTINKPEDINLILGQAHFIKTVEDMYEALVQAFPNIRFGLAFAEASGACKVRTEGTDEELKKMAAEQILQIGAGHVFLVFLRNAYPINVLNSIKNIPEICNIFCASANPVEVILAETNQGRGIIGVVDGFSPKGIEDSSDRVWRKDLLRKIGYKL